MADSIVTMMVTSVANIDGQDGIMYAGDVGIDRPLIDFIVFYNFDWILIMEPGLRYVLKNPSGFPIEVAFTDGPAPSPDNYINNITQLGGTNSEVITDPDKYIWARALLGKGYLSRRLYGVVDSSDDIPTLSRQINDNASVMNQHIANKTNPHAVTKTQVGLSDVANYAPASDAAALDTANDANYMTPKQTARLIRSLITVSPDIAPQSIVQAPMGVRPNGWDEEDCTLPTKHLISGDTNTILITAGLQFTYADQGYTRFSSVTTADAPLDIDVEHEGIKYIYCDMDASGTIVSVGVTDKEPKVGYTRDAHPYDFFSIPKNTMFDFADRPIRRTYIGKVYVNSGAIQQIVPTPLGTEYVLPFNYQLFSSTRYILNNPFIEEVDTIAEVLYNGYWGPTGWGYQAGVTAHRSPVKPTENIIVQCGQMGFLASGKESGTPLGSTFENVTEPTNLITRIIVKKHFTR